MELTEDNRVPLRSLKMGNKSAKREELDGIESAVYVNFERRDVYDYNNLTRLAAAFVFAMQSKQCTTVDEIYNEYVTTGNIYPNFVDNFENIFYVYMNMRFSFTGVAFNFSNIKNSIQAHPITMKFISGIVVVFYSMEHINQLLHRVLTLYSLSNNITDCVTLGDGKNPHDNTFATAESEDNRLNLLVRRLVFEHQLPQRCEQRFGRDDPLRAQPHMVDRNSCITSQACTPSIYNLQDRIQSAVGVGLSITDDGLIEGGATAPRSLARTGQRFNNDTDPVIPAKLVMQNNLEQIYSETHHNEMFILYTIFNLFENVISRFTYEYTTVSGRDGETIKRPSPPHITINFARNIDDNGIAFHHGSLGRASNFSSVPPPPSTATSDLPFHRAPTTSRDASTRCNALSGRSGSSKRFID